MKLLFYKQDGQSVILLMLLLVVGTATVLVTTLDPRSQELVQDAKTIESLQAAKEALIGYAIENRSSTTPPRRYRPGELPCPDYDNNGGADYLGANCRVLAGWLPWTTIGLDDIRDSASERLWYIVADDFYNRSGVAAEPVLNSETAGQFVMDGNLAGSEIAAVIIAPGRALTAAQVRDAMDNADDIAKYLEDDNADLDNDYVTEAAGNYNDVVIFITVDEIMRIVERRAALTAAKALRKYYAVHSYFPYAAVNDTNSCVPIDTANHYGFLPIGSVGCFREGLEYDDEELDEDDALDPDEHLPSWFIRNNWDDLIYYAVSPLCTGGNTTATHQVGGVDEIDCTNGTDPPLNGEPAVFLTSTNAPPGEVVEALVISSGRALDNVNNNCGAGYDQTVNRDGANVCAYLDNNANTNDNSLFVSDPASDQYNDILEIVSSR